MLVLGGEKFVDWRFVTIDTIDDYTQEISKQNGVIGIAHPFNVGSPICTGCYWDFNIKQWEYIDYIEVWSRPYPNTLEKNKRAFTMWDSLLQQGHKISATSGRDWHVLESEHLVNVGVTYLGAKGDSWLDAKQGLKDGRVFVTLGPYLEITITQGNMVYELGDELPLKKTNIKIKIDQTKRTDLWQSFHIKTRYINIIQNGTMVATKLGDEVSFCFVPEKGYLRIEVYGDYMEKEHQLIAFSSPVYIK